MRNPAEREIKKEVVLSKCFGCLMEKGIEATTIKDFSEATGMATSSIYYWFEDKDEIVFDATNYCINYVVDNIFTYSMQHLNNIPTFFNEFPDFVQDYKSPLKTIIQITTSKKYGEKIKETFSYTENLYDKCAERISSLLNAEYSKVRILVDLFVSTMIDYVIWDEKEKFVNELAFILSVLENAKVIDKENPL